MQIIDADGHIVEGGHSDEMAKYMPKGNQRSALFPVLDHLHFTYLRPGRGGGAGNGFPSPDAGEWVEFLDGTGIDWTVVYPTSGLAVGRIASVDWAVAACQAYNSWLYEKYTNVTPRIKGMALIPIQDPQAACEELHRAVEQLGMPGAMLPSTGERSEERRVGKECRL